MKKIIFLTLLLAGCSTIPKPVSMPKSEHIPCRMVEPGIPATVRGHTDEEVCQ